MLEKIKQNVWARYLGIFYLILLPFAIYVMLAAMVAFDSSTQPHEFNQIVLMRILTSYPILVCISLISSFIFHINNKYGQVAVIYRICIFLPLAPIVLLMLYYVPMLLFAVFYFGI